MTNSGVRQDSMAPRRGARTLLLGWAAFCLVWLAQPFCDAWAGHTHGEGGIAGQSTARVAHGGHDNPSEPCCAELTDAILDVGKALDAAFLDRADGNGAPLPSAAWPRWSTRSPDLPVARATPPPVDASPLYLRTLRLRI